MVAIILRGGENVYSLFSKACRKGRWCLAHRALTPKSKAFYSTTPKPPSSSTHSKPSQMTSSTASAAPPSPTPATLTLAPQAMSAHLIPPTLSGGTFLPSQPGGRSSASQPFRHGAARAQQRLGGLCGMGTQKISRPKAAEETGRVGSGRPIQVPTGSLPKPRSQWVRWTASRA